MVIVQQGTEAGATDDRGSGPVVVRRDGLAFDELPADALVKTLGLIVVHELLDHKA